MPNDNLFTGQGAAMLGWDGSNFYLVTVNASGQLVVSALPKIVDEFGTEATAFLGDNMFQGAPVIIDSAHHEVHCGDHYMTSRSVDLGGAGVEDVLIRVPNEAGSGQSQKLYHMVFDVLVESETDLLLYEGTTVSANGTQVTNYNRERNSANTSSLGVYYGPTVTAVGTLIMSRHWGSGRGIGGGTRSNEEIVLKNNTNYLLRLTNATATNNYISWLLDHYIHPGI